MASNSLRRQAPGNTAYLGPVTGFVFESTRAYPAEHSGTGTRERPRRLSLGGCGWDIQIGLHSEIHKTLGHLGSV